MTIAKLGPNDVAIQDQSTHIVGIRFNKVKNSTTLAQNAVCGDIQITVASDTNLVAGDRIRMTKDTNSYVGKVLSKAANVVQLDSPLDHDFPSGTSVQELEENLVNSTTGTRAAPDVFTARAPVAVEMDITEIVIMIEGTSTKPDTSKFGSATALVNGIVLRKRNAVYTNITNVKNNLDMERFAKVEFTDRGSGGVYLFKATYDLRAIFGIVFRIGSQNAEATNPPYLELLVQESLAGNTSINVIAKGHIVQ